MKHHKLLLDNLDLIDRLVRFSARRHHLSFADTEEFASIVRLKLVEDDCAVLRKFQGRSRIGTYLTVVVDRLCHDYDIARWGKWRPSAKARRLGQVAILLERIVVREGATFDEAVGTLQTNHSVSESRDELHQILLELPTRVPRRGVTREPSGDARDKGFADPSFQSQEEQCEAERISVALESAFGQLSREDQRILKLRFEDGLTFTHISSAMNIDIRVLYRRVPELMRELRSKLEALGVSHGDLPSLVGNPTTVLRSVLARPARLR